ncbi:MAG: hypothetical protein CSB47_07250 [Proteobacteria bacterium]|nr:MAG: hypothetical protein CSB47_07250 [Pseudomonadota bacterium]
MLRDSVAAQRGQGWLIGFAALVLIAAVAAVAYTVIYSERNKQLPEPASLPLQQVSLNDDELQSLAETLVTAHLSEKGNAAKEDLQALGNTLRNLNHSPHQAAKTALQLLTDNNVEDAVKTLKALALNTQAKRDAAKMWVDIGNISNLNAEQHALDSYQKSVTLDPDNINAWNRIGHLARKRKHYDEAEIAYQHVTRLSDELSQTQALSFANFGLLHQSQNQYDKAITSFSEALRINDKINNNSGAASNHENLASLYRTTQDYARAEQHYKAAFDLYKSSHETSKLIEIHSALGSLYQGMQRTQDALKEYEKALALSQDNPNERVSAGLYSNMGILAQRNNDPDKAEAYFKQALALYQAIQQDKGTADQLSNLAILARGKKQFQQSEALHQRAIELYQQGNHPQAIINQYINLGFLYTAWNKKDMACDYWQKSLKNLTDSAFAMRKQRIEDIVKRDCKPLPAASKSED